LHLTLTAGPKLTTCYAHWLDKRAKLMAREKQKDTPTTEAASLPLTGRPKQLGANHAVGIHSATMTGASTGSTAEIENTKLRR
jgi:hypothetical protein